MKIKLSDKLNIQSVNINCLRVLSAILVLVCHSYAITQNKEDVLYHLSGGQCNLGGFAVAIFFFLSGLYVTKSLYKVKNLFGFFKKRCVRLFPQLWITIIASIVLGAFVTKLPVMEYLTNTETYLYLLNGLLIPVHNLPGVFDNQIYETVNGPLWTMPVEFVAYLALAFTFVIAQWLNKNKQVQMQKYLHIVSYAVLLVLFLVVNLFIQRDGFLSTVIRPVIFFYTGTLYCDYSEKIILNWKMAIIVLALMVLLSWGGLFNLALILGLPYLIVVFCLATKQIKRLGELFDVSYEMYLVGWPIQQLLFLLSGNTMSPIINIIYTIPLDVFVAWLLYKMISILEQRLIVNKGN